ncbi:MAG: hypothetical protein M1834_002256 [Cirrosporium novae-zelandiae]|nr:MAG: hypothetical protein M1834_002256 [Cirrosporium novae-zelandiae]
MIGPHDSHGQFPVSNSSLSNSATTTALRRGQLKISDPIPIPREGTDGLGPQSSVATPYMRSTSSLRHTFQNQSIDGSDVIRNTSPHLFNRAAASPSPQRQHKRALTSLRDTGSWRNNRPRVHSPTSLSSLYETMSSCPSSTMDLDKKRRNGGIKTVLKKIFGTVKGRDRPKTPGSRCQQHHRSEPINFINVPANVNSQRTVSLPISEIIRNSSSATHPTFGPSAGNEAGTPNSTLEPIRESRPRPRRATIPSVVLSSTEETDLKDAMSKLGVRPRSQDANSEETPENIGYAVTSGGSSKRRSRSVDALRELAQEHNSGQWRRRSDEIKYWRASTADGALERVPSCPEDTTVAETQNPELEDSAKPDHEGNGLLGDHQSFDFGPTVGNFRNLGTASIEERVTTLEVKMADLERAIVRIQSLMPGARAFALGRPPKPAGQRSRSSSVSSQTMLKKSEYIRIPRYHQSDPQLLKQYASTSDLARVSELSRGPPTFLSSPGTSPSSSHLNDSGYQEDKSGTRQKGSTFSSNGIPEDATLTMEHYNSLLLLIKREQSARRNLEVQLAHVQQEVKTLRLSPAIYKSGAYPTHSLDHKGLAPPQSELSAFDSTGDDSDSDDGYPKVFETPVDPKGSKYEILDAHYVPMI